MKILKNNKGITLAILVVTIVVLLILAGVTISNITGGDGILGQASSKKDATTIQKEKTILGNAVITASNKTKLGDLTENNLRDALSNKNVDIVKSGGLYKITFKDTNNLYKMNENGEYFYWENMQPTKVYGKIADGILYLRATEETGYEEGTKWNDATITKVIIEEPIAPSTCQDMFNNCTSLEKIENIKNLHTENVLNMERMFLNCSKLSLLDLKYLETSNVIHMGSMFNGCTGLKSLDLSGFNTNNVINMDSMFKLCSNLTILDVSGFNTSSVKYMGAMFNSCNNITQLNLSNFDTRNVIQMQYMFTNCNLLTTLDLSSFNTSLVTRTDYMFSRCGNLTTIYTTNNFVVSNVNNSTDMFTSSKNLVGGFGTSYNSSYTDKTYARIDNPPDEPGYFTLKQ